MTAITRALSRAFVTVRDAEALKQVAIVCELAETGALDFDNAVHIGGAEAADGISRRHILLPFIFDHLEGLVNRWTRKSAGRKQRLLTSIRGSPKLEPCCN